MSMRHILWLLPALLLTIFFPLLHQVPKSESSTVLVPDSNNIKSESEQMDEEEVPQGVSVNYPVRLVYIIRMN